MRKLLGSVALVLAVILVLLFSLMILEFFIIMQNIEANIDGNNVRLELFGQEFLYK